ncbi:hypothetical protein AGLY_018325, partial [Aphis glycines]
DRLIEVIYLTTEECRCVVPLVKNARLDIVSEFGLELKEIEGGRQVTFQLNQGDDMLGEMLLYQYTGFMEFQRATVRTHQSLLDNFLIEENRRVFLTPIPYERPDKWLPTTDLLGSVSYFNGRFHSTKWSLKIKFLINLGRKIISQKHVYIVGDKEIPASFDHHIHTASLTLPFPLKPRVVEQSIVSLKPDLITLIQSNEFYKKPIKNDKNDACFTYQKTLG